MEKKKLYIIGAGGFGREVAWLVERINSRKGEWNLVGFIDDNPAVADTLVGGVPVVGTIDSLLDLDSEAWCVCAIGSVGVRRQIIKKLENCSNLHFPILLDPDVSFSSSVSIGEGSIICAGSIITVDVSIGRHVIVNLNCTVGHDAEIGDFTTVAPSVDICGHVTIGECCNIGVGAQIIQGITIEHDSVVGAGAVVVRDASISGTYVGVPARLIKSSDGRLV